MYYTQAGPPPKSVCDYGEFLTKHFRILVIHSKNLTVKILLPLVGSHIFLSWCTKSTICNKAEDCKKNVTKSKGVLHIRITI